MIAASALIFGIVLLLMMELLPDQFEKWYAISFLSLWVMYAFAILRAVRPAHGRYIYRILSQTSIPPKYPRISMAAKQYIWMNQPVDSLSELCHVEGSTTTLGLTFCVCMAWVAILFFLLTMKYRRPCEFQLQFTDLMMYAAGFLLYSLQLFKLDRLHDLISSFHVLSVAGGAFFIIVVIFVQGVSLGGYNWIIPAFLSTTGLPALYLALYKYGEYDRADMVKKYEDVTVDKMTKEIRNDVSNMSRRIVAWEVYAIMCAATGIALWMWQYDQPCAYGCRGPRNSQCHAE